MMESRTVRDPAERCDAEEIERPGRTHLCRLQLHHHRGIRHECVCARSWLPVPRIEKPDANNHRSD